MITQMIILIFLFLLSETQNYMLQLEIFQQETIKNYENFSTKNLKDSFIGINRKQELRMEILQINTDFFSNQNLLELIDYFL